MFRNSDTEQCLFFVQTATCTFISNKYMGTAFMYRKLSAQYILQSCHTCTVFWNVSCASDSVKREQNNENTD